MRTVASKIRVKVKVKDRHRVATVCKATSEPTETTSAMHKETARNSRTPIATTVAIGNKIEKNLVMKTIMRSSKSRLASVR